MPWLKAYEWERARWPWHRKVNILGHYRVALAHKLARLFGIELEEVKLNKLYGGVAWYNKIALPRLHKSAHSVLLFMRCRIWLIARNLGGTGIAAPGKKF